MICSSLHLEPPAWTFADNGVSGFTVERPQVSKARDRLEIGDVLTVWKLDRVGRNTRQFLDIIEIIRESGAGFRCLTEGLMARPCRRSWQPSGNWSDTMIE